MSLNTKIDYYPFGMMMPNRHQLEGTDGYRYGFNGMEKDDEITSVEGSHLDFGARIYDSRVGRWMSRDPLEAKSAGESPYIFVSNIPTIYIDPDGKEKIVVVGAQYDNGAGSKMMFVHHGISQIYKYQKAQKKHGDKELLTMAVFIENYTPKQLARIEQHSKKHGYNFVKLNSADDLVNYVNSQDVGCSEKISNDRQLDKISDIDIFAHGVSNSIVFGYKTKLAEEYRFDEADLKKLDKGAFKPSCVINSEACRTANATFSEYYPGPPYDGAPKQASHDIFFKVDESLAQKMADHLGVTVEAYVSRTDYSGTLGTRSQRVMHKLGLDSGWLEHSISNQEKIDGAVFDPDGAYNPVSGGVTPVGSNTQKREFTPSEK